MVTTWGFASLMSWDKVKLVTRSDGDLKSLERPVYKRIPSAKDYVSITDGLHLLAEAQPRLLFLSSFIQNLGHHPCYYYFFFFFFEIWEQTKPFYARRKCSLTYKLNPPKTSPFLRNVYKEKKKSFFMTEKSFPVD